jgi:hypothetical protein
MIYVSPLTHAHTRPPQPCSHPHPLAAPSPQACEDVRDMLLDNHEGLILRVLAEKKPPMYRARLQDTNAYYPTPRQLARAMCGGGGGAGICRDAPKPKSEL